MSVDATSEPDSAKPSSPRPTQGDLATPADESVDPRLEGSSTADPAPEPQPVAAPEPDWKNDEYLTSGGRFLRWNLITLVLGVVALGAGVLWLQSKG